MEAVRHEIIWLHSVMGQLYGVVYLGNKWWSVLQRRHTNILVLQNCFETQEEAEADTAELFYEELAA